MKKLNTIDQQKIQIVFLATFWGTKFGGINCFNIDLCNAIATHYSDEVEVICIVLNRSIESEGYKEPNVKLISLGIDDRDYDFTNFGLIENKLRESSIDCNNIAWWIGHDFITGYLALFLRDCLNRESKVTIIHHMDNEAYKYLQIEVGLEVEKTICRQRECLEKADLIFGVGPYLTDNAKNFSEKPVKCLIPGIDYPIAKYKKSQENRFSAITFGRFDPKSDKLKKSNLAVEAFGKAYNMFNKASATFKNKPIMCVVGIEEGKQNTTLINLLKKYAEVPLPIRAIPYIDDRKKMLTLLSEFDVCLVLSIHEGFSLTGWEAIAMGVPLIISEETGLVKFLKDLKEKEGLAMGCIETVVIHDDNIDIVNVAQKIGQIACDKPISRKKIKNLKDLLLGEGYTWERTAKDFMKNLKIISQKEEDTIIPERGKSDYYCQKENLTYPETLKWLGEWKDLHNRLHDTFEKMRSFTKCINSLSEKGLENLSEQDVFYLENNWEDLFNSLSPIIEIIENLSPLEDNNLTLLFENLKDKALKYNAKFQDKKWYNINKDIGAKKFINEFKGDSVEFDDFINKILYLTDQEIVYLVNFLKNRGENGTSIS